MKILVIEDEKGIADFIKLGLKEEGYIVDIFNDGRDGYIAAKKGIYNLIIVDLNLPSMDGIEICSSLRNEKIYTPIIILTVKNRVSDKVKGFDAGANDYLTKPFAFEELLARIKALLFRNIDNNTILKIDDLELNMVTHKVTRGGDEIELTAKEYSLLEYFMLHKDIILTRVMIMERIWEVNFDTYSNSLDVYINRLRNKVDKGFDRKLIHTIKGRGYTIKG